MAHTCEECGFICTCDGDDTGGLPQLSSCRCLMQHMSYDQNPEWCSRCGAEYANECDCEERSNEDWAREKANA